MSKRSWRVSYACKKHGQSEGIRYHNRPGTICVQCRDENNAAQILARAVAKGQSGVFPRGPSIAAAKIGVSVEEYITQTEAGNRYCKPCKAWKPAAEFAGSGRVARCGTCIRIYEKERSRFKRIAPLVKAAPATRPYSEAELDLLALFYRDVTPFRRMETIGAAGLDLVADLTGEPT